VKQRAQCTRLPSRLSYSPLLRDGVDSESDEAGRIDDDDDEAAGRLAAGLLVVRLTAGRDFGPVVRGRDVVDFGFAVVAFGLAAALAVVLGFALDAAGLAALALLAAVVDPAVLVVLRREDEALGLAAGRAVRLAVVRDVPADRDRVLLAVAGLAADIDLAAAVSALAAVDIALVAVFIALMADDSVLADEFALVAAAVILPAADVTLVAADETVLAAAAGVAEFRLAAVPRVDREAVERAAVERDPFERDAVERDAADRDAVLRVDRDAVLRVAVLAAVLLVDLAAPLRVAVGLALDVLELDVVVGRLAVPLDALRLTDLLRAVLAELRRLAARVVD
jgi:hypothetical protein